jgi:hypothetical protein
MVWKMSYYEWELELDEVDRDMVQTFDEMRTEDPVLWLVMVMGPITPKNIATKLGWPAKAVLWELRQLKKEGQVIDSENGRAGIMMVWDIAEDVLIEEKAWLKDKTRLGGWSNPRPEERDEN